MTPTSQPGHNIPFRDALRVWIRVAIYSFGGPAGQIAVIHKLVVEEKRWVSEQRFLHALNYTMLLPGPEAQQLATYLGWLLHGMRGGLVAGLLFILPGFLSILLLSILYAGFNDLSVVQGIFYGLKPAVLAIVIEAVLRIGRRALRNRLMVLVAAAAFVAIFFFNVPFPLIILGAGVLGALGARLWPAAFPAAGGPGAATDDALGDYRAPHTQPNTRRSVLILVVCAVLWAAPLVALWGTLGGDNVFTQIGLFFSRAAGVTFGGAYAVLAYIGQAAVQTYGWLLPGEMLDGLGMAETTPGPLIQVVQFVGFMAAFRNPGTLPPLLAGVYGAVLTTWVTFVPCFLWIFLGAPYIERLRGRRTLGAALGTITAAVVGVILNLAIWFSLQVLFGSVAERSSGPLRLYIPDLATLDWAALVIAIAAFVALLRYHVNLFWLLAGAALAGLAVQIAL